MRTVGPRAMYIAAVVAVVCAMFWVAVLFLGYAADDLDRPAASERSVPPPPTY